LQNTNKDLIMAFDINEYKNSLKNKINERYSITEVSPTDVSQTDLGLDQPQTPTNAPAPTTPNNQTAAPKAKDPEISMEVLRGTVQWALSEKDGGKSSDEIINQLAAMKKPGLIDFIRSYLDGSGQQAPATDNQNAQQSTGEPATDDLSGLTAPSEPPADNAQPDENSQNNPQL
jgi:hypothetical protein